MGVLEIRQMTTMDREAVAQVVYDYCMADEIPAKSGIEISYDSIQRMIDLCLFRKNYTAFLGIRNNQICAIVGGGVVPFFHNMKQLSGHEFINYGEPEALAAVTSAFDAWAKDKGASCSICSCYTQMSGNRFRRL